MTYLDIEKQAKRYYPAVALDTMLPRPMRGRMLAFLAILLAIGGVISLSSLFPVVFEKIEVFIPSFPLIVWASRAVFFLLLSFFLPLLALHSFAHSYYFRAYPKTFRERAELRLPSLTYEVAAF